MTSYQLAWDDTRTGRLRPDDDESLRPLAWLRVTWGAGHEVDRVDIYGDGARVVDRVWMAEKKSVRAAVEFCHARMLDLRPRQSAVPLLTELGEPWEHHSIVELA
ncbi:hypothetical protein [Frondihabitans cladoniiphilus]|uniref:Uncharacterized protein n=1 Tax=Frondihabitans cladoniiphilus TaxID=715785 RepID=A0ABP8WD22_9MICO